MPWYQILGFHHIIRLIFIVLAQQLLANLSFYPTKFAKEAPPMVICTHWWINVSLRERRSVSKHVG